MKLPRPFRWPRSPHRLLPGFLLALWLASHLLLAGHGHWDVDRATSDCEICLQLASATPALDCACGPAAVIAMAVTVDATTSPAPSLRGAGVTCRGPPALPRHLA